MAAKRRIPSEKVKRQRTERRAPFATATARGVKRAIGPSTTSETPLHIRALRVELEEGLREHVRARTGFKLGKFGLDITRISVRFEDVAGPKGAPQFECRFKVILRSGGEVAVGNAATTQRAAFEQAVAAVERAVRRTLEKRARTTAPAKRR